MRGRRSQPYISPYNRPKTSNPKHTHTRHLIHPQPLPGKQRFPNPLTLILGRNALRTGQERIFAYRPIFVTRELDDGDVAQRWGGQEKFTRAGVEGFGHFAADGEFFEGELEGAF